MRKAGRRVVRRSPAPRRGRDIRHRARQLADLTVLSADIMKIPEPEILKTKTAMTVIGGEIVFEADKQ